MDKTAVQFNVKDRLGRIRYYEILTSRFIVSLFLLCILGAIGLWILLIMVGEIEGILALILLLSSISGGLLLAFVYGSTYFPYIKPPSSTATINKEGGRGNIAQTADFSLLETIGRGAENQDIRVVWQSLLKDKNITEILNRLQLNAEGVSSIVETALIPVLTWERYSQSMLELALSMNRSYISKEHAFGAFMLQPELRSFIRGQDITEKDIQFILWWSLSLHDEYLQKQRWWAPENLLSFSGVGLSWAAGYTLFIDKFSFIPSGNLWDLPYGHETQVENLISALAKEKQSNVLLVGEPGVGRLGIIKEVARRVENNQAHPALSGQRVIYLHLGELLALGGSGSEQLAVISKGLREIEQAGNVIAVIDGLGSILGAEGEGRINLTDVLLPFFASQSVRVAVIMAPDEYHARVRSNSELLRYFEVVNVPALSAEDTLQLLTLTVRFWEAKTGIFMPYPTLREIVDNTASILPQIPFPEKAFDILEESIVVSQGKGKDIITKEDVNDLISRKIGVNVGKVKSGEREHLLQLDEVIHRRVVNQVQAVSAVSKSMMRARAGVRNQNTPIGTFLFLGPTGVGKTETSKALAEAYFGSEDYMQRLDMSEFQGQDGVARLIGSLEHPTGRLTSIISDHPFTVLLLDEFEKADRSVQQLFLQVFDEGHLSDASGRKFSFNHAIIIATSNAGSEFIRSSVKEGKLPQDFDEQVRNHILEEDIFRPELVNRFDGVITFTPLSKEHLKQIAELMLRKLNKRLDQQHGITVMITPELLEYLVEIGYDPEFGARPMTRAIKDTVEYAVAEQIVKGQADAGQDIKLQVEILRLLKNR